MALGYAAALRRAKLDAITTFIGTSAILKIYSGTRPATGGTATTLLAQLTCSASAFAAAASGSTDGSPVTLTANSITQDSSADSGGTATWFRIYKSDGTTFCMDGSVSATGGGGDLQLTTTTISATQPVSVSSFVITEGNP